MPPLPPLQEAFARHYALHGNGAAAYRASYNPEAKGDAASEYGRRLLKRTAVLARVGELRTAPKPLCRSFTAAVPKKQPGLAMLRDLAAAAFSETLPSEVRREAVRALLRLLPTILCDLDAACEPTSMDDAASGIDARQNEPTASMVGRVGKERVA